jgi:hypothetical protein
VTNKQDKPCKSFSTLITVVIKEELCGSKSQFYKKANGKENKRSTEQKQLCFIELHFGTMQFFSPKISFSLSSNLVSSDLLSSSSHRLITHHASCAAASAAITAAYILAAAAATAADGVAAAIC